MITKAWHLLRIAGHDALFCLLCDKYTFHPQDIGETYCGYCHTYLRDVPMQHRRVEDDRVPNHDPIDPRAVHTLPKPGRNA